MTEAVDKADIVIAGGGIVGLSFALALASQLAASQAKGEPVAALSIRVIERHPAVMPGDAPDSRVSAINHLAMAPLQASRGWPLVQARSCAYQKMTVWDHSGLGEIHFDAAETGVSELGFIVENTVLVQALRVALEAFDNVRIDCPQRIAGMTETGKGWRLDLADGARLDARLLVAADGANSWVRKMRGIALSRQPYRQQGLVCNVRTELPHQATAWQCFMPSGPLALLPLFDGQCSIVWSLDDARAEEIMALDDAAFCAALARASDYRLGEVLASGERRLFPLAHGHVRDYVQNGLALIGDAAHTIHPLAGQGANLGIADALCLADVIVEALRDDRQWHAKHTLLRYQRRRKAPNRIMEDAMTGFKRLFGQEHFLITEARSLGLSLVDALPPVKNAFMRRAMGR